MRLGRSIAFSCIEEAVAGTRTHTDIARHRHSAQEGDDDDDEPERTPERKGNPSAALAS